MNVAASITTECVYGDECGAHITVHGDAQGYFLAVYRTEFHGMCFPIGSGITPKAAVRDLWRRLHDDVQ